ncbi:MmcQ/YjbR family DNA-binding protein [Nakamurella silvestris]|nr:MmcQ/YjbR family DNA-binding protein [Nakamurella silvestris]
MWTTADVDDCFARVTKMVAHLPEVEAGQWHSNFRLQLQGKRFASVLVNHHGDGRLALSCKAAPGDQQALIEEDPERYFVPSYDGAHGWVGAHLDPEHHPNWDQIGELLVQAWREAATVTMLRKFDADNPTPVE